MKRFPATLFVALLGTAAMTAGQQQTPDPHRSMEKPAQIETQTEAQKSFAVLKGLAGNWQGPVSNVAGEASVEGKTAKVTLRETSMGNALLHEMKVGTQPDDPITMMYLDEGRLLLTHYCDAGIVRAWWARFRPMASESSSSFLTLPVTSVTTCTVRSSPSLTRTITPKIGRS